MKLSDLLKEINFTGDIQDCEIRSVTHDSRKVKNGSLFVAISGMKIDGHDFIKEAIQNGAAAILSNGKSIDSLDVPVIKVSDPRTTLSQLSANMYGHPSKQMTVIGITGTNGKTSVTCIINKILKHAGIATGALGTLGFTTPSGISTTGFTTPEATEIQQLFKTLLKGGVNHLVMEVSSHALELKRVCDVEFDMAVFTNLTEDHLDFHGNMEEYFKSKLTLFNSLGKKNTAVLNHDDPWVNRIISEIKCNWITYGLTKKADLFPEHFDISLDGINAVLKWKNNQIKLNSPLIGEYNLYNLMAAVGSAVMLEIPIKTIEAAISSLDKIPGRMEKFRLGKLGSIIVDYAHSPDAYTQLFSTIKSITERNIKLITVFGCGGNRDKDKRPKMAEIAEKYSDEVIVTTDNPRDENLNSIMDDIKSGFKTSQFTIVEDRKEAIQEGINRMTEDSLLLLLGKGCEDHQLIKGEKVPHNEIEIVKSFMV